MRQARTSLLTANTWGWRTAAGSVPACYRAYITLTLMETPVTKRDAAGIRDAAHKDAQQVTDTALDEATELIAGAKADAETMMDEAQAAYNSLDEEA